jgi:hypothetical protein
VLFPEPVEHRARQNQRAHLRQHDNQDPAHVTRCRLSAVQTMQQRDEPAEWRTEHPVDPALSIDIQQDRRILAFAGAAGKGPRFARHWSRLHRRRRSEEEPRRVECQDGQEQVAQVQRRERSREAVHQRTE